METTSRKKELTLLEQIVLLGLDDKGWFAGSEHRIKYAMAGAILFELYKQKRITINGNLVCIGSKEPLADPVLNRVLAFLCNGEKERSLKGWIQRIVMKKLMIRKTVIKSLIGKKILKKEEYSLLWVLYQYKYPVINTEVKHDLQQHLYDKIISRQDLADQDMMFISVMENCKMIRKNFHGFENFAKLRKNMREIILFENPANDSVKVVQKIHMATNRAIIASNVSIHA